MQSQRERQRTTSPKHVQEHRTLEVVRRRPRDDTVERQFDAMKDAGEYDADWVTHRDRSNGKLKQPNFC